VTKEEMYHLGWYRFEVPPVHQSHWEIHHWIQWIDTHGEWLPNQGKIPYFMTEWLRKLGVQLKDKDHYDAGTLLETGSRMDAE